MKQSDSPAHSATAMMLDAESLSSIEAMHRAYQADPTSVDESFVKLFKDLGLATEAAPNFSRGTLFRAQPAHNATEDDAHAGAASLKKQERVDHLIRAYRSRGHRIAAIDPLGQRPKSHPELELAYHGLSEADLKTPFSARSMGGKQMTLADIISHLRNTYCRSIGVQFMHIDDGDLRAWLQMRMESTENRAQLSFGEQRRILAKLTDAEVFETFTAKKYLGARRFSLEGGESLIPLLDTAIEEGAQKGVSQFVIGMAHRGRLNVLANIIGKSAQKMFVEFEDSDPYAKPGMGDVKYHLGYSHDHKTQNGKLVHLSLCFNPSHLGFVGAVAAGRVRAKQDRMQDVAREQVLGIVVHGDAAFCGQGATQELLNMSRLPGYTSGGTVHIIVNNQVGFTTLPEYGRSSPYATDVARMLEVPIFHVNGEDPEGVTQVVRLALAFRHTFHRDVIIDMYCYRKLGHNESDEPAFTQPVMYQWINQQPTVRERYLSNLKKLGEVTQAQADEIYQASQKRFEDGLALAKGKTHDASQEDRGIWRPFVGHGDGVPKDVDTGIASERIADLMNGLTQAPSRFAVHPKLIKMLDQRQEMGQGKKPLDWGAAEALAFASLVDEGVRVRLSGQDSGRGTFSHRHAVLHDANTGALYTPLQHVREGQGIFEVHDSPLSETGVLGFDYGYSLDMPEGLVMWEAQFGDFCNGAQVIIDQFIASGEAKWQRLSGIALLLPHGYEGAGAEHSSARLERFLTLAAQNNLQVVNPTTPAQIFHVLRRQVLRPYRKPLIVMTPKSLLRHPRATSGRDALSLGTFLPVIDESDAGIRKSATKIVVCSGKLYYDLLEAREKRNQHDVAIVRAEQLYPDLPQQLACVLAGYQAHVPVVWAQEEPMNMGAWPFVFMQFGTTCHGRSLSYVGRDAAASPAVGSHSRHKIEQDKVVADALATDHSATSNTKAAGG